jgi:triosephosphate isomerase
VAAAVRHGLTPLICVGETLAEREAGRAEEVLTRQVRGALRRLDGAALSAEILFAYEPVWAIGEKGIPATADYADQRQALIKDIASRMLPYVPPVLYGGSVNPDNAATLISRPNVDGLFIGRSAWNVDGYIDLLRRSATAL